MGIMTALQTAQFYIVVTLLYMYKYYDISCVLTLDHWTIPAYLLGRHSHKPDVVYCQLLVFHAPKL